MRKQNEKRKKYAWLTATPDTTTTTTRAIIYYMLRHSKVKAKLIAELDEAKREGKLSDPVKYEEATKLKYLQAVV